MGTWGVLLFIQHRLKMSLDLYTRNIPLTQKARFWGNYVSALKGNADLCAAPVARVINFYPSITETIPPTYPGLRQEFGKLETLMWRQHKGRSAPTPVLPEANDRIHTLGWNLPSPHRDLWILQEPGCPRPVISLYHEPMNHSTPAYSLQPYIRRYMIHCCQEYN